MSEAIFAAMEKLERELAEAKQEIERLDTRGIHSCHDNCQRPMCVLRRELKTVTDQRDEALSDLEFRRDLYKIQTKRLDDVCEQRDRLAEACRLLMKIIGPLENPEWATDEEIDRAYDAGEAALEAITEASND